MMMTMMVLTTTTLISGAAVDYTEGFVGCMRALQVNGEMLDLMGKVERGEVTYGVSAGLSVSCLQIVFFVFFCDGSHTQL